MYTWFIVFILAIIAEAATLQLVAVWFACGALSAMLCAFFGASPGIQVLVFFSVSAIFLLLFFFLLKKKIKRKEEKTNVQALIKSSAVVEEKIEERGRGRVVVCSQSWMAEEENGEEVEKGERVEVVDIRGATLIVRKEEGKER